jgi:hypothetical protein
MFDAADIAQTQNLSLGELWRFLPVGYLATILIETPVLLIGLPRQVPPRRRLWLGVWLTACTYPIVVLVLPAIFFGTPRSLYLAVAETFAPVGECFLFWLTYRNVTLGAASWVRALVIITLANLASFAIGEVLNAYRWFGIL